MYHYSFIYNELPFPEASIRHQRTSVPATDGDGDNIPSGSACHNIGIAG
jgi:hypothetical protein